jgi:hypothetical protein
MVPLRSAAGSITLVWRAKVLAGACIISLCTSSAFAHDWYTGLVDPVTGSSCCGGQDCRPVPRENIRFGENGDMELFLDGGWRHVDPRKILKISSPDSRVHACWFHLFQELRCVILPGAL